MSFHPGEVWETDLGEVHENGTAKHRPSIIISRETLNRGNALVIIPTSSRNVEKKRMFPNNVFLKAGTAGLTDDCVAQTHAIQAIATEQLVNRIGHLPAPLLTKVLNSLLWTVDYLERA